MNEISQLAMKILDYSCGEGRKIEMEKCISIVVNQLPLEELGKHIFEPNEWIREKVLARINNGD